MFAVTAIYHYATASLRDPSGVNYAAPTMLDTFNSADGGCFARCCLSHVDRENTSCQMSSSVITKLHLIAVKGLLVINRLPV